MIISVAFRVSASAGRESLARVAELADAHGSGPCAREGVGVQVPPRAPQVVCTDDWNEAGLLLREQSGLVRSPSHTFEPDGGGAVRTEAAWMHAWDANLSGHASRGRAGAK